MVKMALLSLLLVAYHFIGLLASPLAQYEGLEDLLENYQDLFSDQGLNLEDLGAVVDTDGGGVFVNQLSEPTVCFLPKHLWRNRNGECCK